MADDSSVCYSVYSGSDMLKSAHDYDETTSTGSDKLTDKK